MKKLSLIPLLLCASTLALAGCNLGGSGKKSSKKKSSSTETSQVSGSSQEGGSTSSSQQGGGSSSSSGGSQTVTSVSFSDMVSAFAEVGISGVSIPDYHGAALTVEAEDGIYQIGGSSHEEMMTFVSACTSAGWVLEQDEYEDYSGVFGTTLAAIYIGDYIGMTTLGYDCILIQFSITPSKDFPSAEIASDLATLGITDTIPAFEGTASGYKYYAYDADEEFAQLMVIVDEDGEDAAVSSYQATFLAAGYTEAGEDDYGDMHYTSPNSQIDVCVWDNPSYYPGHVYVDIAPNS